MVKRKLTNLIESIAGLRRRCLALEAENEAAIERAAPQSRNSARNLLHYLAVRQHDISEIQEDLSSLGLASLGRLEANTMATLDAVLKTLHQLAGIPAPVIGEHDEPVNFVSGPKLLAEHAEWLLGPSPEKHPVRIMVTMPSVAAHDAILVRNLLEAGMNIARINCGHDGPEEWVGMVANLRLAESELGRSCKVIADLSGPKLRTGAIQDLGRVMQIKPRRRCDGTVLEPARVWLTPAGQEAPRDTSQSLPVEGDFLTQAKPRGGVGIQGLDGRTKYLNIIETRDGACCVEAHCSVYVPDGAILTLWGSDGAFLADAEVGSVPPAVEPLLLYCGDALVLTRAPEPGRPARVGSDGTVLDPARIPCSLGRPFERAQPGERVWFDDGKIGGVIRGVSENELLVEITHAKAKGSKLRPEKGINLPDTVLNLPAMSDKDIADLNAVFPLIDMVGLSFVHCPEDIYELEDRLDQMNGQHLGVVIKIENRAAVDRLPELLLAALRSPPVGVMLARGDLAVEVGFGRLAEIQEQILCLCEAAHVPVIWATQVLEALVKTGKPSRPEVTDAAVSGRAEAVLLNKGPYLLEAVTFLDEVLGAMAHHQKKKASMLRRLDVPEIGQ